MVKVKTTSGDSALKTTKTKFNKNKSFSGVDIKKSPKNRRKSLAAVLPTSKEIKKSPKNRRKSLAAVLPISRKETNVSEWTVSADAVDTIVPLTPRVKKKRIEETKVSGSGTKRKTPVDENIAIDKSSSVALSQAVSECEQSICKNDNIENFEQQFDIKIANVKKAVSGIINFHASNPKLQNQLFQESVPLFLQICCHKMPSGNPRILRIPVPNSVITADDEICLIVPDVKGIKNIEHEKHVEHYEELLRQKGVKNIKKIMTFHEFRTEHETFEQKSRLADLYDIFLVDGRICGKVVHKGGKIFYKKRKVPAPVKLQATKLKEHIDKVLSKVFCNLHLKADSFNVQFGHNKMEVDDLVENIFNIMKTLNKEFPGGFKNVKGLHVYVKQAPSIPIYVSFRNPNEIELSKVNSKKPKAYISYKDELTTLPNAKVMVQPSGRVFVTREKDDDEGDSVITDADIIKANRDSEAVGESKKRKNKRRKIQAAEVMSKKRKMQVKKTLTPKHKEETGNTITKKQFKTNANMPKKVGDSKIAHKKVTVTSMPKKADNIKFDQKKVTVPIKSKNKKSGDNLKKVSKKFVDKKIQKSKEKTKKKGKFTL